MEIFTILIISIIVIVLFLLLYGLNFKKLKEIKEVGESKELNKITNKLPENEQVCKEILLMIGNNNVRIKQEAGNSKNSLYIVATNSILIANIKDTFTRIQTIAHECIHSVQDKKLLWFNFIFSNLYLLYFITITILTVFNKIASSSIYAIVLCAMSAVLYVVRSYIETDAMIKARYITKEYLETKYDLLNKDDVEIVVKNLDKINDTGVKLYNYSLMFGYLIKIVIYCAVAL